MKITDAFSQVAASKHAALMPYLTIGYPDEEVWCNCLTGLAEGGADIIELGLPFSEPVADGPTIQDAVHVALENGFSVERAFGQLQNMRQAFKFMPAVMMTYYNLILARGEAEFVADLSSAGIAGLLVPDLPIEEAIRLKHLCEEADIDLVQMVAPNIGDERLAKVCSSAKGFIYAVSVEGTTGARDNLQTDIGSYITRIRNETDLPIAVGFGISTPFQAREVASHAEGIIIGSALTRIITKSPGQEGNAVKNYTLSIDKELRKEI